MFPILIPKWRFSGLANLMVLFIHSFCSLLTAVAMVTKIFRFCHKILASVVQERATIMLGIATHSSLTQKLFDG